MIDIQAQDRAHRIGQTRPVVVYRFIVRNTIDERVYKRACSKQIMEKLIVHDELKQGFDAYDTVSSVLRICFIIFPFQGFIIRSSR